MVLHSSFMFSAPVANWSNHSLESLQKTWLQCFKKAFKLSQGTASCCLRWPAERGGKPILQPKVLLLQSLITHVQNLVKHTDHVLKMAQFEMMQLWQRTGSTIENEIGHFLLLDNPKGKCEGPIEQLLLLAAELGETIRLPISLRIPDKGKSWFAYFQEIVQATSWNSVFKTWYGY